jgi:hypothetical protein
MTPSKMMSPRAVATRPLTLPRRGQKLQNAHLSTDSTMSPPKRGRLDLDCTLNT